MAACKGRRALGCFRQAALVLRWFINGTRLPQLPRDDALSASTAYRYLHEGLTVLAAGAPDLATALERAKEAGPTLGPGGTRHPRSFVIASVVNLCSSGTESDPEPRFSRRGPRFAPQPCRAPRNGHSLCCDAMLLRCADPPVGRGNDPSGAAE